MSDTKAQDAPPLKPRRASRCANGHECQACNPAGISPCPGCGSRDVNGPLQLVRHRTTRHAILDVNGSRLEHGDDWASGAVETFELYCADCDQAWPLPAAFTPTEGD